MENIETKSTGWDKLVGIVSILLSFVLLFFSIIEILINKLSFTLLINLIGIIVLFWTFFKSVIKKEVLTLDEKVAWMLIIFLVVVLPFLIKGLPNIVKTIFGIAALVGFGLAQYSLSKMV